MKKIIGSFLISLMCIFNAFAVTEGDLKDVADCMAAISITNVDMELKGDYKNSKLGDKMFASLMTLFYEKLEEYRKSNPNIDSAYLGQMPNRAVAKYSNMGDLQQLKYAQSVLNMNRCFQYTR